MLWLNCKHDLQVASMLFTLCLCCKSSSYIIITLCKHYFDCRFRYAKIKTNTLPNKPKMKGDERSKVKRTIGNYEKYWVYKAFSTTTAIFDYFPFNIVRVYKVWARRKNQLSFYRFCVYAFSMEPNCSRIIWIDNNNKTIYSWGFAACNQWRNTVLLEFNLKVVAFWWYNKYYSNHLSCFCMLCGWTIFLRATVTLVLLSVLQ